MAIASMGYAKTAYAGCPEILYHANYVGEAITLDSTAFTSGVCLAGTPIDKDGKVANTGDALGIVLTDVYSDRPVATIVVEGYINKSVAQAHSGVTLASAAITALSGIKLR